MKSIRTKISILVVACVLLCSIVVGAAGVISAKDMADKNSAQIMNLICSQKSMEISAKLNRIEQSVDTIAAYALGRMESVERLKNDEEYLKEFTRELKNVAITAVENTEGAVTVYTRYNPEFTPPTSGFFWGKTATDGRFRDIMPTDFSYYPPADAEHIGWYSVPVKNGRATWMIPYLNEKTDFNMISFIVPVYLENKTVGVIGMDIDFNVVLDNVQNMRVYETGHAFLVDEKGTVIYHKDTDTMTQEQKDTLQLLTKDFQSGTSGNMLYTYEWNGEAKKLAFRTLSNGMRLAITAPEDEIDAAKSRLLNQIYIAVILIIAVSILLTFFVTRQIVRPLRELNVVAKKIAGGDLSVSISSRAKDEVGTLADSLQQTVNHLQKHITYINELAYRDALTGVKNKTAYQDAVKKKDEEMRIANPKFAVGVFDVNGLKRINDTYGHDFGDILISQACKAICKAFKYSPVYRIGGDEFVVILENKDLEDYPKLLEELNKILMDYNLEAQEDNQVSIASGVAVYDRERDKVFGNLFKRADDMMYENKAAMKKAMEEAKKGRKNEHEYE